MPIFCGDSQLPRCSVTQQTIWSFKLESLTSSSLGSYMKELCGSMKQQAHKILFSMTFLTGGLRAFPPSLTSDLWIMLCWTAPSQCRKLTLLWDTHETSIQQCPPKAHPVARFGVLTYRTLARSAGNQEQNSTTSFFHTLESHLTFWQIAPLPLFPPSL